jgi:hypothetical protein
MIARGCIVAVALATAWSAVAIAHQPARTATREIVRIQGRRGAAPAGTAVVREVSLTALGQQHRFFATDWQRFGFADEAGTPPAEERPRLVLQGKREQLARFAAARPEQTITILAERRPGSADLFLLALDLCPP